MANTAVATVGQTACWVYAVSHGCGSLRALLIQASKRLLTTVNPLQKWGLSVALRRCTNKAEGIQPLPPEAEAFTKSH